VEGGPVTQISSTPGGLRPPDPPLQYSIPNFKENMVVLGAIFVVQGWFIGVRDHPRSYLFLPLRRKEGKKVATMSTK